MGKTDEFVNNPRGLMNLRNTCYFNSVLQTLCHTHVLCEELLRTNQGKLKNSFIQISCEVLDKDTASVDPTVVFNEFIKKVPRFKNYRQHDSHECLRHFLDEIRKEEKETKVSSSDNLESTTVDRIFGGHLITVYFCKGCLRYCHLFEPCLDISLPVFFELNSPDQLEYGSEKETKVQDLHELDVDQKTEDGERKEPKQTNLQSDVEYNDSIKKLTDRLSFTDTSANANSTNSSSASKLRSKDCISIDDCFNHFSRVEEIDNEYLCEVCLREAIGIGEESEDNLKLTSATKQTLIFNPPAVLTIHFKRFELLPGRSKKRKDMVKYPEHLDIAPYCSSQCLRNDPPKMNIWYSLYAVVVHSGSLDSGHYVAYVKVSEREDINEKWKEKFLQHEYFNHNITSDELIEMMKKQEPRKTEVQERDESKRLPVQNQRKSLSHISESDEFEKMLNKEDEEKLKDVDMSEREEFNVTSVELIKMTNTNDREEETGTDKPELTESKWFLLNDSCVREASTDEVLKQEAYLLFYERTDDTEISAAAVSDADYSVNSLKLPDQKNVEGESKELLDVNSIRSE